MYLNYLDNKKWYHISHIIPKLLTAKWYKKYLIPGSPLLIVFYDLICNNLVITHVYYYLLIYIPLMLLKKITSSSPILCK